ncbi:MAG TPA: hypothetical protein PLF40_04360 [Kofleriaceae bacterium]|nr:hypothetical protein [Kofleriaceae bacterium]
MAAKRPPIVLVRKSDDSARAKSALWQKLDAGLRKAAPDTLSLLNPGASPHYVAWLTTVGNEVGVTMHPAIIDTYRAHDGADNSSGIFALLPGQSAANEMPWLSLPQIEEELPGFRSAGYDSEGGVRKLLPVAAQNGDVLYVAMETAELGLFDGKTAEAKSLGVTLPDFLATIERAMDEGRIGEAGDGLEFVAAPAPAGAAASANESGGSPAQRLLAAFIEQEQLLIEGKPSKQLIADVDKVLAAKKSAAKRAAALLDVFDDHDEIEDVFIDDDALEAAIKDLG